MTPLETVNLINDYCRAFVDYYLMEIYHQRLERDKGGWSQGEPCFVDELGTPLVHCLESQGIDTRELRRFHHTVYGGDLDKASSLWEELQLDLEGIALRLEHNNNSDRMNAGLALIDAPNIRDAAEQDTEGESAKSDGEDAQRPEDGEDAAIPAELTDRQQEILVALLRLNAVGEHRRVSRAKASRKADSSTPVSTYNRPIATLADHGLIRSKKGPTGGIWLTPEGETVAKSLQGNPPIGVP
jgi:hypothetical protein